MIAHRPKKSAATLAGVNSDIQSYEKHFHHNLTASQRQRAALLSQKPHGRFDRSLLPDPVEYFARELGVLRGRGTWRDALCCFHQDTRPSLRVNTQTGAYRCMSCGASGCDVLAFQRQRYGQGFIDACRALGCWEGTR